MCYIAFQQHTVQFSLFGFGAVFTPLFRRLFFGHLSCRCRLAFLGGGEPHSTVKGRNGRTRHGRGEKVGPKRIAVISCSAMRAVKFAIYSKDRRCFITNLCLVLFARNGRWGIDEVVAAAGCGLRLSRQEVWTWWSSGTVGRMDGDGDGEGKEVRATLHFVAL